MKKTLKIGNSDFKKIVENNHYFVDKTSFIYDFFSSAPYILLMPRPSRFGKTLNLSMIEHFFDINKKDSAKLFSEFEISKNKEFCKQHQNKYPVINLSLKKVKADNLESSEFLLKSEILNLYKTHKYLLESDKLDKYDKNNFNYIISGKASFDEYKLSLKDLSQYLRTHFNKDVIILVDEYDTPIIYSYDYTFGANKEKGNEKYYKKTIAFMRTFLGEAFKGNNSLQKGLITGITRISRESIFSEWNNFNVFSVTSNYFSDSFGFTEKEIIKLLEYFNLQDRFPKVKQWYDGYIFGTTDKIYNPWSIVNYVALEKDGFKPYWVNTSSDILIKERITEADIENEIQKLIAGDKIEKVIDDNFIFADFDTDKELLWTLLTYSGYLTQVKKIDEDDDSYELKIPNFEVKKVFKRIIIKWLNKIKIKKELLIKTTEYLINNQINEFEKGFKLIIADTISYFDIAKTNKQTPVEPESIYHVYTLGLLTILSDDYIIKSNRETGGGRYDIILIPYDKTKNGVVIEIKKIEKRKNEKDTIFNKRINKNLKNALNQIDENKYYKELIVEKVKAENIVKLAIVFAGKEPYMTTLPE